MKTLAIDTALGACSVALGEGASLIAREHEIMVRGHAEKLAPMAERVMRQAGAQFSDIECLAVTTGPGTFTGQRVGLAFVRALMVALKKPCFAATTMSVMAEAALANTKRDLCIVVSDARRDEVYLGAHTRSGEVLIPPEVVSYDGLAARLSTLKKHDGTLAGTGAERAAPLLKQAGWTIEDSGERQPDAFFLLRLAARAGGSFTPPRPLYLRAPDAKLPGGVTP